MAEKYSMTYKALTKYLHNWGTNQNKTQAQKEVYKGYKRFRLAHLGNEKINEENDCIRLLVKDGWDGEYVGSKAPTTAMQYSWKKDNQVQPAARDLLRFAMFFHLGYCKALILIIKSECEKYLYKSMQDDGTAGGDPSIVLIEATDITDNRLVAFSRDVDKRISEDEIYQLFSEHGCKYTQPFISTLIKEIVSQKVQAYPIDSVYTEEFIERWVKESDGISKHSEDIEEQYYRLKQEWLDLRNAIEYLLVQKTNAKERYCIVNAEWAKIFGEIEIEINTLKSKKEELELIANYAASNEGKSYKEVIKKVREAIEESKMQYQAEKKKIEWMLSTAKMIQQKEAINNLFRGAVNSGDAADISSRLRKMQKDLLRKIFRKTHPDARIEDGFTKKQEKKLLELLNRVNDFKEIGVDPADSLPILEEILREAEQIWEQVGIDSDVFDISIIDEKSDKMIKKLKSKIEGLEQEDTKLRDNLFMLLSDEALTRKEGILNNQASIDIEEKKYLKEIEDLKKAIEIADGLIETQFGVERRNELDGAEGTNQEAAE